MRIEPKSLVKRLSPTATRALEAAVGRAVTGEVDEVVPEHLLLAILEADDGEPARVLHRFDRDRMRLVARLERTLERLRTGRAARPVFARSVFDWIERAFLFASVEFGETTVRTGVLFATFILDASRLSPEIQPELEDLPEDTLRRELLVILADSREAIEAIPRTSDAPHRTSETSSGEALRRFTTSFTEAAREGRIDPVLGRHVEIRQMVEILARRRKNNPILVGDPGVGKTALVEGLARAIVEGDVPDSLRDVELVALDLGALQAGSGVRGEFENRLKAVISEVKAASKPTVLFIDEAHTLIGAGGAQGGSDAANLLKPELARGGLRTVAATTWAEYKKYFEKDAALDRRFAPVKVDEPSTELAIAMLRGLKPTYEAAHGVSIRDEAVVAAVELSHRYLTGRQLPDKAIDLLDGAAARAKLALRAKPEVLLAAASRVEGLAREHEALVRDRREGADIDPEDLASVERTLLDERSALASLEARWSEERDAVTAWMDAKRAWTEAERELAASTEDATRSARAAGVDALARALADAAERTRSARTQEALVHAEIDAEAIARVVQSTTGIPAAKMRAGDLEVVLELESRLRDRVRGQDHALRAVAETVRMARAGVNAPNAPVGVLLFVGTSGVGKTETALALADSLYGGDRFLTTINMSEFQEKHSVSRLVGSPPGYVGYGEGGVLTEAVRKKPYSVVLLDECEKADLEVMNLFYQVFDKGTLNDGEGRPIDFRNTLVVLTSNLATDRIAELHANGSSPSVEEIAASIRPILSRHFKPALLARMTVVPFAPMSPEVLREVARQKLDRLVARIERTHGTKTLVADEVVEELVRRCAVAETGARNVDHVLRGSVMPELSRRILEALAAGEPPSQLRIGVAANRAFAIDASA